MFQQVRNLDSGKSHPSRRARRREALPYVLIQLDLPATHGPQDQGRREELRQAAGAHGLHRARASICVHHGGARHSACAEQAHFYLPIPAALHRHLQAGLQRALGGKLEEFLRYHFAAISG